MKKLLLIFLPLAIGFFWCAFGWLMHNVPAPPEIGTGFIFLGFLFLCGGLGMGVNTVYPWNGLSTAGKVSFAIFVGLMVVAILYLLNSMAPDLK